jgi:hypothetical protein
MVISERENSRNEKYTSTSPINSVIECLDADQVID